MSFLPELTRIRTQGGFKRVHIFHPGCRQLLFSLPAILQTHPSGLSAETNSRALPRDDDSPGVNHRLVLDACHIITNHAAKERDCYLSRDHQGQVPVMHPGHLGGSLAPGKYYYHPGPPSSKTVANYPFVTDFAAWQYPAEGPPDHWKRPESVERAKAVGRYHDDRCDDPGEFCVAVAMDDRDVGCVVTKQHGGLDVIRLVPLDHEDWFKHHDMGQYNIAGHGFDADSFSGCNESEFDDRGGVNDPANGFFLRLDLADLLERHRFVFFPAGLGDGKFQFMTYMCGGPLDYVPLLHRRLVTLPLRVSEEFLYARFALNIIHHVREGLYLNKFPIPEGVEPSEPKGDQVH